MAKSENLNFQLGLSYQGGLQTPLDAWPGLGTQPHYEDLAEKCSD